MSRPTPTQLRALLRKLRAIGARAYSWRADIQRPYRDGFTDGWNERATIAETERIANENWNDSAGGRMLHD